jgi:hypothetical protein
MTFCRVGGGFHGEVCQIMAILFTKYFVYDKIIFCGLEKCKKLIYNGTNPHGYKKSPYMPFSSG